MLPERIKIEEYHHIPQKKSLILNLSHIQYQQDASRAEFYNQYRNMVLASLKKKGDVISWQNNMVLMEDEQLSPTFEELILVNVLGLINAHLLEHVRDKYCQCLGYTNSLMDFKADILNNEATFLTKQESNFQSFSEIQVDKLSR
jgi:hypothetical protein